MKKPLVKALVAGGVTLAAVAVLAIRYGQSERVAPTAVIEPGAYATTLAPDESAESGHPPVIR